MQIKEKQTFGRQAGYFPFSNVEPDSHVPASAASCVRAASDCDSPADITAAVMPPVKGDEPERLENCIDLRLCCLSLISAPLSDLKKEITTF